MNQEEDEEEIENVVCTWWGTNIPQRMPSLGYFPGEFFQNFGGHMKLMFKKSFRALRPVGVGSLTRNISTWDCLGYGWMNPSGIKYITSNVSRFLLAWQRQDGARSE